MVSSDVYTLKYIEDLDGLCNSSLEELGRLDDSMRRLPAHAPVLKALEIMEAVSSCAIEEIHAPVESVLSGSDEPEVREILGCAEAPSLMSDGLGIDSLEAMCTALRCVPTSVRGPGEQVYLVNGFGEVVYTPPEGAAVRGLLLTLLDDFGDSYGDIRAVSSFHPRFESIHPFEDGNGRTGRAVIAGMLRRELLPSGTLPLSAFLLRHRGEYYRRLRIHQNDGRPLLWDSYLISGIESSARYASACVEGFGDGGELPEIIGWLTSHRGMLKW